MFELETEVFQLGFNLVEPQSIGQWCVDVQRFSCNFVLLVGCLAFESAHVVQAVANLDEDDADVVAHCKQQLFEVFGLRRGPVTEDAPRDFC